MRKLPVFAAASGAVCVVACQLVAGIGRVEKIDIVSLVADSSEVDAGVPNDPCLHASVAAKPDSDPAPDVDIGQITLGLHQLSLFSDSGVPVGLDLDRVCTCEGRPGTAYGGVSSCKPTAPTEVCDPPGGVDNALAGLVRKYRDIPGFTIDEDLNIRIDRGQRDVILVLSKYNGLANDRQVDFRLLTSRGIESACNDAGSVPGWCGQDRWTPTSGSSIAGTGWVSNYQLVVESTQTATLPFTDYPLIVGSPVFTGHLVSTGPPLGWRVESGIVAGRIAAGNLLALMGNIGADDKPKFCSDPLTSSFFTALQVDICGRRDAKEQKDLDFQNAGCDAISVGLSFAADPVLLGASSELPSTAPENGCTPTADGKRPVDSGTSATYECPAL